MGRALLDTFGLFFAPFVLFALYLALRAKFPWAIEHWTRGRVSLLTLVGLATVVVGLIAVELTAPRAQGLYIPAHVENGVLVPGRFQ